ncbi:MAG: glycerol-3-phosphate dehydrogenase, partial [Candidatus Scalindua sp. AMX11]
MTKETESRKISVLGTGGWGTALAILLHEKGHRVTLWGATPDYVDLLRQKRENSKYLKGFTIPTDLTITSKIEDAQCEANIIVVAIPTPYVRSILEKGKDSYIPGTPLVSVIKGIENETLMRSSEIIIDVLGKQPVILLFGPSHAEEVAKRLPTTVVVASEDDELARETQNIFMTNRFRV